MKQTIMKNEFPLWNGHLLFELSLEAQYAHELVSIFSLILSLSLYDRQSHTQTKNRCYKTHCLEITASKKRLHSSSSLSPYKKWKKKVHNSNSINNKTSVPLTEKKTNFQFIFSCVLIAIHTPSEKTIHYHRMFYTRRQFAYFIFKKKQLQSFVFTFKIRWSGTHFIVLGTFQFRFRTMAISWVHRME